MRTPLQALLGLAALASAGYGGGGGLVAPLPRREEEDYPPPPTLGQREGMSRVGTVLPSPPFLDGSSRRGASLSSFRANKDTATLQRRAANKRARNARKKQR